MILCWPTEQHNQHVSASYDLDHIVTQSERDTLLINDIQIEKSFVKRRESIVFEGFDEYLKKIEEFKEELEKKYEQLAQSMELIKKENEEQKKEIETLQLQNKALQLKNNHLHCFVAYLLLRNPEEPVFLKFTQVQQIVMELFQEFSPSEGAQYLEQFGLGFELKPSKREQWKTQPKLGRLSPREREEDIKKWVQKNTLVTSVEICKRYVISRQGCNKIMKKIVHEHSNFKIVNFLLHVPHKNGVQTKTCSALKYIS